jgi:hypothetical protein
MFELYDVVKLKRKIPEIPLPAGSSGTIVQVYDAHPPAYEVEFPDAVDMPGGLDTLGLYTVCADDLEEGDNSWKNAGKHR